MKPEALSCVVLISGRGGNLKALIQARETLNLDIRGVVCNRPRAVGIKWAEQANIPCHMIDHTQHSSRDTFDQEMARHIDSHQPQLIILAGFMRILSDTFVNRYLGKMINLHPSLLPLYPGLHTHQRALNNQDTHHGASIHFVTCELDGGPVISQVTLTIDQDDTAESLAQRLIPREHALLLATVELFTRKRVEWQTRGIKVDQQWLNHPLQLDRDNCLRPEL